MNKYRLILQGKYFELNESCVRTNIRAKSMGIGIMPMSENNILNSLQARSEQIKHQSKFKKTLSVAIILGGGVACILYKGWIVKQYKLMAYNKKFPQFKKVRRTHFNPEIFGDQS